MQPGCCWASEAYAQSAAAVVLECEAVREAAGAGCGGTVLRGFSNLQCGARENGLRRWRSATRKPPAATWQANAAWDAERHSERRA